MMIAFIKKIQILLWALVGLTLTIIASSNYFQSKGIDTNVLLVANFFFFSISIGSMSLQMKALNHQNPNVFVRSIMGGLFMKMMLTGFALIIYYLLSAKAFNSKAVFVSLFLYLIYLIVEVSTIMKLNKSKNA